jgi:hypothetical protein
VWAGTRSSRRDLNSGAGSGRSDSGQVEICYTVNRSSGSGLLRHRVQASDSTIPTWV